MRRGRGSGTVVDRELEVWLQDAERYAGTHDVRVIRKGRDGPGRLCGSI